MGLTRPEARTHLARRGCRSQTRVSTLVDQVALKAGIREVYFFCADDRVADFVGKRESKGDGYHEIKGVRVLKRVVPAI